MRFLLTADSRKIGKADNAKNPAMEQAIDIIQNL
jgi:hypothetical protein